MASEGLHPVCRRERSAKKTEQDRGTLYESIDLFVFMQHFFVCADYGWSSELVRDHDDWGTVEHVDPVLESWATVEHPDQTLHASTWQSVTGPSPNLTAGTTEHMHNYLSSTRTV